MLVISNLFLPLYANIESNIDGKIFLIIIPLTLTGIVTCPPGPEYPYNVPVLSTYQVGTVNDIVVGMLLTELVVVMLIELVVGFVVGFVVVVVVVVVGGNASIYIL